MTLFRPYLSDSDPMTRLPIPQPRNTTEPINAFNHDLPQTKSNYNEEKE